MDWENAAYSPREPTEMPLKDTDLSYQNDSSAESLLGAGAIQVRNKHVRRVLWKTISFTFMMEEDKLTWLEANAVITVLNDGVPDDYRIAAIYIPAYRTRSVVILSP